MMGDKNRVTLEIENVQITCNKIDLITNSDYFKVMFEGNFVERYKSTVKLQNVDLKAMNVILKLLWDENYIIDNEDILCVLQTACMLQFNKIQRLCVDRVTEILSPDNCIEVWFVTEPLNLRPLYLQAKNMSLTEFSIIKEMDCLLELSLSQLHVYLSDVKLRCTNEIDVFETCMKWWYHNAAEERILGSEEETKILLHFLCCIDFKTISESDIKEMISYPDVSDNSEIVEILQTITDLTQGNILTNINTEIVSKAKWLLSCKSRINVQFLCIVVDEFKGLCKRSRLSTEVYAGSNNIRSKCAKNILLFDDRKGKFVKLFSIPQEKHDNLKGFHILGYKEFVFFFGGEIFLGRGKWNTNFWVYDIIRERWERKSILPFGRRYFESCISGNILYIVGGTCNCRIIQDNMFFYNYKDNIWSTLITMPCIGRQIKCCDFNNQLFVLNINNKCGYLFDATTLNWLQLDICDSKKLLNNYPEKFTLFSYKNYLYIKGSNIIEMKMVNRTLEVTNNVYLRPVYCDQMEAVLCDGILYTMYKQSTTEQEQSIKIEKFNMSTYYSEYILEHIIGESEVELTSERCRLTLAMKIFGLQHYSLVEDDCFITKFIF